jgi:hypothetical protein
MFFPPRASVLAEDVDVLYTFLLGVSALLKLFTDPFRSRSHGA